MLLTASTASGKTEAAFFPAVPDRVLGEPARKRGRPLHRPPQGAHQRPIRPPQRPMRRSRYPRCWHWHGDVSQSHKAELIKKPSGILQITPESLEALLIHKHMAIPRMFCDLRYVVIDEVHSLMRGDRGGQTLCLIERLSRMAGASSPAALAFRPPSATPSARVPFSHRERGATVLSPALKNRAAYGASPWSTSTTRVPRHSSGDSRARVLGRGRSACVRAHRGGIRGTARRRPRHASQRTAHTRGAPSTS